jgi:hypothetical protein
VSVLETAAEQVVVREALQHTTAAEAAAASRSRLIMMTVSKSPLINTCKRSVAVTCTHCCNSANRREQVPTLRCVQIMLLSWAANAAVDLVHNAESIGVPNHLKPATQKQKTANAIVTPFTIGCKTPGPSHTLCPMHPHPTQTSTLLPHQSPVHVQTLAR